MKVCLIGCVEFSAEALKKLFDLEQRNICEVVGVITKQNSAVNADFVDLGQVVVEAGKPLDCVHYYQNEETARDFVQDVGADIIYCFGWSLLLTKRLLEAAPKGVVGFHPAALPQNRGRHPIIWALTLGLSETASSFFMMDEGADTGPILSQAKIEITSRDDARSLYSKITQTALQQIDEFTLELSHGSETVYPQGHDRANYWRKRSPRDGLIDWRMEAGQIHNLVRALSPPYPGAEFVLPGSGAVKVWKTRVACESATRNLEPGKVLSREGTSLLVKCGGGSALWIIDTDPQMQSVEGDYL